MTPSVQSRIQSNEQMDQKTVDYCNDTVMSTCYMSGIVLRALHVLTLGFFTTGWLCYYSYFAEAETGTRRD